MNKEPILLLFGHNVQKYRKELGTYSGAYPFTFRQLIRV